MELLKLRETDYEKFVIKFYEAITGEFSEVFEKELLKDENHKETLKVMIEFFEVREEYEKCKVLVDYLNLQ
jgi:hypothetical protein